MVRYSVLCSGSCGNSYIFSCDGQSLLVDAGLSLKQLQIRMTAGGYDPASVRALFLTHLHPDHAHCAGTMARRMHVPVYVSTKCRNLALTEYLALNLPDDTAFTIEPGKPVQEGIFSVGCFYTSHDSAGSCGYTVIAGGRRFTIITDTGVYDGRMMEEAMKADVLFLESNHDIQMLRTGPYPLRLQKRVAGDKGHLSNDQARGFLMDCGYDRSRKPVCLIHLSDNNNDPSLVADAMKDFNSVVCERGKQYDFTIDRT